AVVGVHKGLDLAPAADEQTTVGAVDGHARRRFTRSCRPALLNFEIAGVDLKHLAFILQIVKDGAFTVRHCELGSAFQIDRARNFSGGSVNRRSAVAPSIESKNPRGSRIEDDRIR